jgi:hypothetical protein
MIKREDGEFVVEVGGTIVGYYATHQAAYEAECRAATGAAERGEFVPLGESVELVQPDDEPVVCGGDVIDDDAAADHPQTAEIEAAVAAMRGVTGTFVVSAEAIAIALVEQAWQRTACVLSRRAEDRALAVLPRIYPLLAYDEQGYIAVPSAKLDRAYSVTERVCPCLARGRCWHQALNEAVESAIAARCELRDEEAEYEMAVW